MTTPSAPSPYDVVDHAQRTIAQRLLATLPVGGWQQAKLFWSEAGAAWAAWLLVLDDDGAVTPYPVPAQVTGPCPDLKRAMADPERGAWLLVQLTLDRSGAAGFDFVWDERVYWHDECALTPTTPPREGPFVPGDDLWRAEFATFPRRTPPWL